MALSRKIVYNNLLKRIPMNAGSLIATILRHDRKIASYKIALSAALMMWR